MNQLTVVIPYHTQSTELEESLLSLLENISDECEIYVILNQSYENPYNLEEDEVHFLDVKELVSESEPSVIQGIKLALEASNPKYVYWMPVGVQFQPEWFVSLEILDQNSDLGAFFLDENLLRGGFFRRELLEQFLPALVDSDCGTSDVECLTNLVSLIQEANILCGLAEFEVLEQDEKSPASDSESTLEDQFQFSQENIPDLKTERSAEVSPAEAEITDSSIPVSGETLPVELNKTPEEFRKAETGFFESLWAMYIRFFKK